MLEIKLLYWPAEADVPAVYAARVGSIQTTGESPIDALTKLGEKLASAFPRPLPSGLIFEEVG